MFRTSVMYPNHGEARFDIDYYRKNHFELVRKLLTPFGLVKMEVDRGISGGAGQAPPYICVGQLYFDSRDGYDRGVAEVGLTLKGDIPNFTNVTPIRQISEILE
jgi:uncharacterized protein (TIGR02118 family)